MIHSMTRMAVYCKAVSERPQETIAHTMMQKSADVQTGRKSSDHLGGLI